MSGGKFRWGGCGSRGGGGIREWQCRWMVRVVSVASPRVRASPRSRWVRVVVWAMTRTRLSCKQGRAGSEIALRWARPFGANDRGAECGYRPGRSGTGTGTNQAQATRGSAQPQRTRWIGGEGGLGIRKDK
ncbi:hypothetical protein AG1IA_03204 [Rhizoctonia solani AG-1 IA]|uniref:Uncharacterized protein n=1 Tax=Thanatephorus cucumeris (strain AG1-IA) TaxID=983506 RepID=L8WXR6_THACA|nr:hypothetical protein AG1IA_03204 [Rhizoctonia solani AG-1 IA]